MNQPSNVLVVAVMLGSLLAHPSVTAEEDWTQFRGPNGSGHGGIQPSVPVDFGPETNLQWRCSLPRGLSSPCVIGEAVFLTSYDADRKRFNVYCVDRNRGEIIWQKDVDAEQIEKVHKASSPANATVVADHQRIFAYFASCGIYCYDHSGNAIWTYPLPVSQRFNGSGTSPILAGGRLILNREDDREKYLLALDAETGDVAWKTSHGGGGQSFGEATPILWRDQLLLHRHYEVAAFDVNAGDRLWSVTLKTTAASTPVIDGDVLYVAAWNNFGEADLIGKLPPFEKILKQNDSDDDGMLSREEMPWGPALARRPEIAGRNLGGNIPVKFMFSAVDTNRDGKLSADEWASASDMAAKLIQGARHGMTAIELTHSPEDVTTKILWEHDKSVPEVPSPLVVGDHVYMVKNGGILTCFEKNSGDVRYRRRLKATGPYIASPITVNDLVLTASSDGVVTQFRLGPKFERLASVDLGEPIMATPAVADGVLYVRTDEALYAFKKMPADDHNSGRKSN